MCFSATASFSAGIVLTAAGIATVKKVQHKKELLFASIPLLFAAQQFTEGLLWLSLTNARYTFIIKPATYLFLLFAQVIWPLLVPVSMLLLSENEKQKKILSLLTAIGFTVSGYLLYCLYLFPIAANILGHHIRYQLDFPAELAFVIGIYYFAVTVFPPLFLKSLKMKWLSLIILGSYIFTRFFFAAYFISLWCFFAAIISIVVWAIIDDIQIASRNEFTIDAKTILLRTSLNSKKILLNIVNHDTDSNYAGYRSDIEETRCT